MTGAEARELLKAARTAHAEAGPGALLRNTAELSGELSVGDLVAVGEAGLAVGRAGWALIPAA